MIDSQGIWATNISSNDRVLVTGASGWFGRNALQALLPLGAAVLPLSSDGRKVTSGNRVIQTFAWDTQMVEDFSPNVIFDLAFLTRDKLADYSVSDYITLNEKIVNQAFLAFSLPTVERVVGLSSGAATGIRDSSETELTIDPYGVLKYRYEKDLEALQAKCGFSATLARAWSVSGQNPTKPNLFAFSDLINQAREGQILINTADEVFRRYVAIDDFLGVSLALAKDASFKILDSGGELLEIAELANLVAEVVGGEVLISRPGHPAGKPNRYYSDNLSWDQALRELDFKAKDILQQISDVLENA